MKLRKLSVVLLALLVVLSLASCGGGGGGGADDPDTPDTPVGSWLCFTSTGESTVWMNVYGTVDPLPTLEYSKDGTTWEDFVIESITVELADGEKVYFRGNNTSFSDGSGSGYLKFEMTGSIAASGNVMSLLDKTCESVTIPNDYCFSCLFDSCDVLTSAPELPATALKASCYSYMFYGCENLAAAPELPAASLEPFCYMCMFYNCSALNSIKVHFTDWNFDDDSTSSWVYNVADTGTFTCPSELVATVPVDGYWGEDKVPTDDPSYQWNIETF